MQPQIDVWKVIEICLGVASVLLIPAVLGMAQLWAKGKETAGKVDDLKKEVAELRGQMGILIKEVATMSGMLQGKFGMGDSGHQV